MSGSQGKPKRLCAESARMLLRCMQESECMKGGKTFVQCLRDAPRTECQHYRDGYFECKRGLLDMRNRLRGNKFAKTGSKSQ